VSQEHNKINCYQIIISYSYSLQ